MAIRGVRCLVLLMGILLVATGPWAQTATEDALDPDEAILASAQAPWRGDLEGMIERGMVRVATSQSLMNYFLDGASARGITYELTQAFQEHLRRALGAKARGLSVVVMPVARDALLPALLMGRADIAAASLTITPEREALVDFADPLVIGVNEIVVTGPAAPAIDASADLEGVELHMRRSSSYWEHAQALNKRRESEGKAPFTLVAADENLEDEDLLEMVHAGLLPATVVDDYAARFWAQIFKDLVVHEDLVFNRDGAIAWAMRKNSPQLTTAVNDFVKTARKGMLLGNVLLERYLKDTKWVENAWSNAARERFETMIEHLRTYASRYDFDWLMIAAQGYQESQLDQKKRSPAGAIGVMQVLPATAADPNVGIPKIEKLENNIHAGVRYLRFLRERYFNDPSIDPLDQALFSFAAYNAGPANIARARRLAATQGLDSTVWFGNVELAAARTISREPVQYVRNIYKYYVAYGLLAKRRAERDAVTPRPKE